ncbi:MAG TPA: DUF3501 family protein [Thermoanaerobaculia bacterium]|jgi:hypothetical protein|nr:DUF3501 family protein [Thermoanaerobaculia bacterium]
MEKIEASALKNLHEYEVARPEFRRLVIDLKSRRRVAVGPVVTLVFENRETALFQIQEMLRAERIVDPAKVQDEIDVYNTLLPDRGEVAATLFIEITDESRVKPILDAFIGLDEGRSLRMEIAGHEYFARFEAGHGREDKISAVHYVRFPLGEKGRAALESARSARLVLEHGDYRASAELSPDTVSELIEDLRDS